jgi:type II secretory ATPase GspE/PulE/Tfp pilus assembly ATPase PilB-like protein
LEPVDGGLSLRLRTDGVLREVATLPREVAPAVIARLKVLASLPTYVTELPQDGRIPRPGADLRLSTYPTVRGEKAAVRFFARSAADFRLDALGLPPDAREALHRALAAREGLVILTGPAGSGKTTTIYAALQHLRDAEETPRQIVTIEDPVECLLPGVTQTEVNPAAGLTLDNCLRSVLRQDPEVIMVGEVRDRVTATLAAGSALTGHLVITTLHAGTAPGIFSRLLDMGLEGKEVTSTLRLAMAQRLLRRACGACRGRGCGECGSTGHRGRLPVVEFIESGEAIRTAVLGGGDLPSIRAAALSSGMIPLRRRAEELLKSGLVSADEVRRSLAGVAEA